MRAVPPETSLQDRQHLAKFSRRQTFKLMHLNAFKSAANANAFSGSA